MKPFPLEAVEASQCYFFEKLLMKHKWVTLRTMQSEIYHQNSQYFYPSSELFLKNHITMRHPVRQDIFEPFLTHPSTSEKTVLNGSQNLQFSGPTSYFFADVIYGRSLMSTFKYSQQSILDLRISFKIRTKFMDFFLIRACFRTQR